MITRIWQGWTTPENADDYETLLTTQIFADIRAKAQPGLTRLELLRRPAEAEVEFLVLLGFADGASLRRMTGSDMDKAYIPDAARTLLKRAEPTARHFEPRYLFDPMKGQSHAH